MVVQMYKTSDYRQIVINEIPLIDLRAPIEYAKGAFINATNLPLMNDKERSLVGKCYKEEGAEGALKLGYKLISGNLREERIKAWIKHSIKYPNCVLYCFRGGSRSKITQKWLKREGTILPIIDGGYKAFRNYLLSFLTNPININSNPILLGGYTGSEKTALLNNFHNFINLEKLAHHRGSSFGGYIKPQPTQIDFENNLSYKLIQHNNNKYQFMLLEDEGRNIGKNFIPKPLAEYFNQGDLIVLNVPFEKRSLATLNEYVVKSQKAYIAKFADKGLNKWENYIKYSLSKIKKRLGNERYTKILNNFEKALKKQLSTNDYYSHTIWIEYLLTEYYDPMYEYQIKKRNNKIIFQGNNHEVYEFIKNYYYK